MGANIEAFANRIRKIGFWNVESRVIAFRQREHFRAFPFYRPDDDENDDDDDDDDDDDGGGGGGGGGGTEEREYFIMAAGGEGRMKYVRYEPGAGRRELPLVTMAWSRRRRQQRPSPTNSFCNEVWRNGAKVHESG